MHENSPHPLSLGFIGGALNLAVGYTHFNSSRLDGHFRVDCGCFSRNPQRNAQAARVYGVNDDRTHANWTALLEAEKGKVDALLVITPTPEHADIVVAALHAGYSVICEKALATSSAECRVIADAVQRNNGFLAVTYNYSGYPMVRELRRLIAVGALGRIHQIHIEMPQEGFMRRAAAPQAWRLKDETLPTVSLDLGVHVHHLVQFLTGKSPLEVIGDQSTYGPFHDVIDNVYCLARYEDDLRVQSWFGKTALGYRNGLRFACLAARQAPNGFKWSRRICTLARPTATTSFLTEAPANETWPANSVTTASNRVILRDSSKPSPTCMPTSRINCVNSKQVKRSATITFTASTNPKRVCGSSRLLPLRLLKNHGRPYNYLAKQIYRLPPGGTTFASSSSSYSWKKGRPPRGRRSMTIATWMSATSTPWLSSSLCFDLRNVSVSDSPTLILAERRFARWAGSCPSFRLS